MKTSSIPDCWRDNPVGRMAGVEDAGYRAALDGLSRDVNPYDPDDGGTGH